MKKIELLAPAGDFDSLIAAVNAGADAVYISGKSFGARKYAKNFDGEELKKAVEFCHIRDVKVYLTVNTLVADEEFQALYPYVKELYDMDVDALIVQDIGVLRFLKNNFPDFNVHVSTQMTVHNTNGVKQIQENNVKRVVLSRELTLDEIGKIRKNTSMEIEVFIHGALCISYSGQCLFSSMIGGRSGNRGSCAQPCRRNYKFEGREEYFLSPKDLCTLDELHKIIDVGADSLKVEGRMKGPEYVYSVISKYRQAIDLYYGEEIEKENNNHYDFRAIFNRGYTKGNIFETKNSDKMSYDFPGNRGFEIGTVERLDFKRKKIKIRLIDEINVGDELQIRRSGETVGCRVEHVFLDGDKKKHGNPGDIVEIPFNYKAFKGEKIFKTYDALFFKNIKELINSSSRKTPISMECRIVEGQAVSIKVYDKRGNFAQSLGNRIVEKALKIPLTESKITEQLSKMGHTPYYPEKINLQIGENVSVPVKEINGVRRDVLYKLDDLRKNLNGRKSISEISPYKIINNNDRKTESLMECKKAEIIVSVNSIEQLEAAVEMDIKTIYYKDIDSLGKAAEISKREDINMYYCFLPITSDFENEQIRKISAEADIKKFVIGNIGDIENPWVKNSDVIANYSLNVFNTESARFLIDKGLRTITLSPELNLNQIREFKYLKFNKEITVFGYQRLMIMKYCPADASGICKSKSNCILNGLYIEDEKDKKFFFNRENCNKVSIYNSSCLNILEYIDEFMENSIYRFRLDFTKENGYLVKDIIKLFKDKVYMGIYDRDFELEIKKEYDINFTRGHINRGVIL